MSLIRIQFTKDFPGFGNYPAPDSDRDVLALHYVFPGKLDRGTNAIGYHVWGDDLHLFEAAAKQRGMAVEVLK